MFFAKLVVEKEQMREDIDKLIELHRQFTNFGYADYAVEIREHNEKVIVTIKAGQNYRFEIEKNIID